MQHKLSDISSRRGVYSGLCTFTSIIAAILLSSRLGEHIYTKYVQFVHDGAQPIVGTIPKGAALPPVSYSANDMEFGSVINPDAHLSFIHLSANATTALEWLLLYLLFATVLCGVLMGSMSRVVIPCLIAFVYADAFNLSPALSEKLPWLAAGLLAVGSVLVFLGMPYRKPAMIDKVPRDASALTAAEPQDTTRA